MVSVIWMQRDIIFTEMGHTISVREQAISRLQLLYIIMVHGNESHNYRTCNNKLATTHHVTFGCAGISSAECWTSDLLAHTNSEESIYRI
jgi:hypothetical protein